MPVNRFQIPALGQPSYVGAPHPASSVRKGLWRSRASTIIVPLVTAVPLSYPQNLRTCIQLFADEVNGTAITIGPPGVTFAGGTVPNSCYMQLDPGRHGSIFVDDPLSEAFDLGLFFAILPGTAVATARLYLTFWDMV